MPHIAGYITHEFRSQVDTQAYSQTQPRTKTRQDVLPDQAIGHFLQHKAEKGQAKQAGIPLKSMHSQLAPGVFHLAQKSYQNHHEQYNMQLPVANYTNIRTSQQSR